MPKPKRIEAGKSQLRPTRFHVVVTPTPSEIRRETARRLRRLNTQAGEDIRRMRLDASISMAAVGRATGIDAGYLSRIEAGVARPSNEVLIAIGVALGAELSVRYFPGSGPRIHDRFQAPMVEALLRELHPRWRAELEVPISQPARGVIDAVLRDIDARVSVATEVHSDLHRLEQQVRWGREKAEGLAIRAATSGGAAGAPSVSQLLVLRSTVRHRQLARQYSETLRTAFPARVADLVAALTTADAAWPGPGILWVHLHGSRATLMRHPPTGVDLGR
jgi:transcriptional regulator with XRE-family HTH domain